MKKKIQIIIAGIIIVAGSFLYAHIAKNNYIYDRDVDTSEYITTGSFRMKLYRNSSKVMKIHWMVLE